MAEWLDKEGYPNAAAVLRLQLQRFETISLVELNGDAHARAVLIRPDIMVRIYSMCYHPFGYWRPKAAGYTSDVLNAGIFSFPDAWECSSHAGSEKEIVYQIVA